MQTHETTIDGGATVPLQLTIEMAQVLARLGDDYTRKGFFFHRHVRALGDDFDAVRGSLEAPPKLGLYSPFHDYPTRDYLRVFHAAALKRHPQVSTAQAHRLLAREELGSYLELAVGRVTFGMFSDPMAFILAYDELCRRVMSKPIGRTERLGDRHVQISYDDPIGSLPYAVGALEGIIMAFKMHPRVTARITNTTTTFDLRWDV